MALPTLVPSNVYERVLRLDSPTGVSSAFTIEREGTQYLITARHCLPPDEVVDVRLSIKGHSFEQRLRRVPVEPPADVAVLRLRHPLTATLPVVPCFDGCLLSQDIFFLGYPYGMSVHAKGLPTYAFVKKGVLAATGHTPDGVHVLYLDAIDNPGFSGGPVVFTNIETDEFHLAGVVSGYRSESLVVHDDKDVPTTLEVDVNTGIVLAHDIVHAVEAIDSYG